MKKHNVWGAVSVVLLGSAGSAVAQSQVNLYGLLDTSITYVNNANANGDNLWAMGSGNLLGNRWGLKGSEDLGGGLRAIFTLENGFNPNTGALNQGGRMFGRQSFVGIDSAQMGTLTLGRQYDPLADLVWPVTGDFYFGSVFATPGDVDNYDTSSRTSNAIKYTSPVIAGLQFEGMYALGGVAGRTGSGQTWSAGISYNNGPLSVAGGYFYAANSNPAVGGVRTTWSGTSDGTFDGSLVNGAYISAKSIGIARAAARYSFAAFNVGIDYSNALYRPDGMSTFASTEKYDTGRGYLTFQADPRLLFGVGYSFTRATGDAGARYHQVSLGADYTLSKRTDIYLVGAWQKANGSQRTTTGGLQDAQASVGSYGYGGKSTQSVVALGLRHKF
ncbi:porin [Caballeronia sp. BCC1704]|uniref:porin n=1 Tax=Caballeronia sp. BCC1704 TaxID=2676300 RepID=UPI00158D48C6|nr:porin [Caballeronia sp. BCC1704]